MQRRQEVRERRGVCEGGRGPSAAAGPEAPPTAASRPLPPSLARPERAGTAGRKPAGSSPPACVCSSPAVKQPCPTWKAPTEARTCDSHGSQANRGTLSGLSGRPSPGSAPRSPGEPPGPCGECEWEMRGKMGPSQQYFKPQRTISVAKCKQNLPNAQNKCLRKSIFPAGCAN